MPLADRIFMQQGTGVVAYRVVMSGLLTTCVLPPSRGGAARSRASFHRSEVSDCECCSEDSPALHFRACPRCGRAFEPRRAFRRAKSQTVWSIVREFIEEGLPSLDDASKAAWTIGEATVVIAVAVAAAWRLVG